MVRLSVYSAAAGLRLWMDVMSDTEILPWNLIFIFQRAPGMRCATLGVFLPTDPLYQCCQTAKITFKTMLEI